VDRILPSDEAYDLLDLTREIATRELAGKASDFEARGEFPREVIRTVGRAGLLGLPYPEAAGGAGQPYEVYLQVLEILAGRWLAIAEAVSVHTLSCYPVHAHGSERQRKLLPDMLGGELLGAYCLSEPQGGSDAAHLATRAVRDGDDFVVDGQKVWTTNGQHADVGYLLARTNPSAPKHRGITAFALDMRTPGVDVRPLREITGTTDFNEVFFDSVRIPAANVIGEVDNGWRVANSSLGHERSGVGAGGVELLRQLEDLVGLAGPDGLADSAVRQQLGGLATRVLVNQAMTGLVQSRMLAHTETPADAPLSKIFFSEINHDLAVAGMGLQGVDGLLTEGDPAAVEGGWWQDAYLYARAYTIAGGANEVLRNLVAERALGLPRDPA
jgi:alkylation response protein AidB-like acyl-CoA dehydrogenase